MKFSEQLQKINKENEETMQMGLEELYAEKLEKDIKKHIRFHKQLHKIMN